MAGREREGDRQIVSLRGLQRDRPITDRIGAGAATGGRLPFPGRPAVFGDPLMLVRVSPVTAAADRVRRDLAAERVMLGRMSGRSPIPKQCACTGPRNVPPEPIPRLPSGPAVGQATSGRE